MSPNFVFFIITIVTVLCVGGSLLYRKDNRLKNLYLVFPQSTHKGPSAFATSVKEMVKNNTHQLNKLCNVIVKEYLSIEELRYLSHIRGTLVWFQWGYYFDKILSDSSIDFSHVLYGPNVTPLIWMSYPYPNSYEVNWKDYMSKIFGCVIHYPRVRDHIMLKSKTTKYIHKYIFFRACTKLTPSMEEIKSWENRKYDFLIFIKYADIDKRHYGDILVKNLEKYNNIILEYGKYNYTELLKYAPQCKCVIYYSFYDTGAIALQEIQNYGVFAIVVQKEFVDEETGVYIPELENDTVTAAKKCEKIIGIKRNSKYLARYNQKKNSCLNSFRMFFTQISNLMNK